MSEQRDLEPVYMIDEVTVTIGKSLPPTLIVWARATVNTGGWSSPMLTPVIYTHQPLDGIQDFTFDAVPPDSDGVVIEVLLPLEGTATIELADWMKGARVRAATNSMEALLPER